MTPRWIFSEGWLPPQPVSVGFEGWIGLPLEDEIAKRFETFAGPGIIDPWKDPWLGPLHQEDDELLFALASFVGVL